MSQSLTIETSYDSPSNKEDWCPIEVSPVYESKIDETLTELKTQIQLIKTNVQFLLDRVLAVEDIISKISSNN